MNRFLEKFKCSFQKNPMNLMTMGPKLGHLPYFGQNKNFFQKKAKPLFSA